MTLTLQEHMDMLGMDTPRLARLATLPEAVIMRALSGQPISGAHADRIAQHLAIQHGLPGNNRLQPGDIEGLVVVSPEMLRAKK